MVVVSTKVTAQNELTQGRPNSWERRRHLRFSPVEAANKYRTEVIGERAKGGELMNSQR